MSRTEHDRSTPDPTLPDEIVDRLLDADTDVEALCQAHPALAEAIRRAHADHWAARQALGVDAVDTVRTSLGARIGTFDALVDRLRARGPVHLRYRLVGTVARGGMGVVHRTCCYCLCGGQLRDDNQPAAASTALRMGCPAGAMELQHGSENQP